METFVEEHYLAQIEIMETINGLESLASVLRGFCADEVQHRTDANAQLTRTDGRIARVWAYLIAAGSALGVRVARKV